MICDICSKAGYRSDRVRSFNLQHYHSPLRGLCPLHHHIANQVVHAYALAGASGEEGALEE